MGVVKSHLNLPSPPPLLPVHPEMPPTAFTKAYDLYMSSPEDMGYNSPLLRQRRAEGHAMLIALVHVYPIALAYNLMNGLSFASNPDRARDIFEAHINDGWACFFLATGPWDDMTDVDRRMWLMAAADLQNSAAIWKLTCEHIRSPEYDMSDTVNLMGRPSVMYHVGLREYQRNPSCAIELFKSAARMGHVGSMHQLIRIGPDDCSREYLELAVRHGCALARGMLMRAYWLGTHGFAHDEDLAVTMFNRYVEEKQPPFPDVIGLAIRIQLSSNHASNKYVARFLRRLYGLRNSRAAYHLAIAYLYGRGVKRNPPRAFRILDRLARRGGEKPPHFNRFHELARACC